MDSLIRGEEEYLLGKEKRRGLIAGKIAGSFQGCACSLAERAGDFVKKLTLQDKEIVGIEPEAGFESLCRGVERHVDPVFIAVDPSFEPLALVEKTAIWQMASG